jgi:hypothetical protein
LAVNAELCGGWLMGVRTKRDLPARLEGVRRRFETWRRRRKVRSPIPKELWAAAVKMAGTYGIHRTAKALRVDYYALKKRVEGSPAVTASSRPAGDAEVTFVELSPPAWPGAGECMLAMEDAGGAKLRVRLKGFGAPDLAALTRSFYQGEP